MPISQETVAISTLLGKLALDANQTRLFIEQQALPFHMPELGVDLKVALMSIPDESNTLSSLKVRPILPGQAKMPISSISTKLVACSGKQLRKLDLSVVSVTKQSDGLMILFNVKQEGLTPEAMAQIEVNFNRVLATRLNNQPLMAATMVETPFVQPDEQGQISVQLKVSPSDQGTVKLPLILGALNQQQTFIFTMEG